MKKFLIGLALAGASMTALALPPPGPPGAMIDVNIADQPITVKVTDQPVIVTNVPTKPMQVTPIGPYTDWQALAPMLGLRSVQPGETYTWEFDVSVPLNPIILKSLVFNVDATVAAKNSGPSCSLVAVLSRTSTSEQRQLGATWVMAGSQQSFNLAFDNIEIDDPGVKLIVSSKNETEARCFVSFYVVAHAREWNDSTP